MVRIDDVGVEVAARYGRLGLPSWPDPHAGGRSPATEEYSRVSAPERYRIVQARAAAWVESLGAVPGIEVGLVAPAALDDPGQGSGVTRTVRLSSTRPATVPLLLSTRRVPLTGAAGSVVVLDICVARASVVVETLPDEVLLFHHVLGLASPSRGPAAEVEAQDVLVAVDDLTRRDEAE